ncbi:hypothetical protein [Hydrogenophaga sp.]|uniref:hypothetical protein n=1 Tax=Hydrogenophaga sp. TaxID=1904254 RepID=UPI002AC96D41|nr:hypothetical protein [Hydrogenophaga sp.]
MIREDYQPIFEKISQLLEENNLTIVSQHTDELIAEWQFENGWILTMECERYSSDAITLSIMSPKIGPRQGYALWILMRAASNLNGKNHGKPNIANQIGFLIDEMDSIFSIDQPYELEYTRLNNAV